MCHSHRPDVLRLLGCLYSSFLKLTCSFVGNRGLCGKQINVICKDDGEPGTNSQSSNSGTLLWIGT